MSTKEENRRRYPRIDARVSVTFKDNEEFVSCYSQNLSHGGIFLETSVLPDPNAVIDLVLDCSAVEENPNNKEIHLVGRVVRLISEYADGKPHHKVALQFLDVSPEIQIRLDHLYNTLSPENSKVVKF